MGYTGKERKGLARRFRDTAEQNRYRAKSGKDQK